jgi:hypothetical protein
MKDKRKTVCITIPAEYVEKFEAAKSRAEDVAMMKLTNTQYASRLIQWALDLNGKSLAVFTENEAYNVNGDSQKAASRAATALMLLEEHEQK